MPLFSPVLCHVCVFVMRRLGLATRAPPHAHRFSSLKTSIANRFREMSSNCVWVRCSAPVYVHAGGRMHERGRAWMFVCWVFWHYQSGRGTGRRVGAGYGGLLMDSVILRTTRRLCARCGNSYLVVSPLRLVVMWKRDVPLLTSDVSCYARELASTSRPSARLQAGHQLRPSRRMQL